MEISDIQDRLINLPHEIQKAGEEYAKEKAEFEMLSELKSVIKSDLMWKAADQAKKEDKKLAEWQVRVIAEYKPEYQNHLKAVRIAQEKSLASQARYIAKQAEFEAIRSLSALEKAMTKNL